MTSEATSPASDVLNSIEDAAAAALSLMAQAQPAIPEDTFRRVVISQAASFSALYQIPPVAKAAIDLIVRKLQERFSVRMNLGVLFTTDDYRPWLESARGGIDFYYWRRYKRLLTAIRFSPYVIRSLDDISDQILDHVENPRKEGRWDMRGMVVGHVQSGKTANYVGLICKAADAGYRVIIVLAGTLNSLRNQTQSRLDSGFIGMDTNPATRHPIGVGLIDGNKRPAYFTIATEDFNKRTANQIGVTLGDLKEPVVLVVKKNKTTLSHLISWLRDNNPHKLQDHPLLLIDDEADHASINTSAGSTTAINSKIRELLRLFQRSSYVGYTATPFANIFIDPESDDEMLGDDLFPRDFILSLDPPDNYIGPGAIFVEGAGLRIIRHIQDCDSHWPLSHKITWRPKELPPSLKEAIRYFILAVAERLRRQQVNRHHSMMVNVSRFTQVQTATKQLIQEYLRDELQPSITNNFKLEEAEALKNPVVSELRALWDREGLGASVEWPAVQALLGEAVTSIGAIEVNSSATSEALDFTSHNYPSGRKVIAVGGLNLSRGLTLEGLSVSYYLRRSEMYDTLMQMGRWFGYREGYQDLCRVYMTPEAEGWYRHIAGVIEELREEFNRMKQCNMTPRDFGLCVRAHPESLIVTARNKMRSGTPVIRRISLEGRLVETRALLASADAVRQNLALFGALIEKIRSVGARPDESEYFWRGVPAPQVIDFVERYANHPKSNLTERGPLAHCIQKLASEGQGSWDVGVSSVGAGPSDLRLKVNGLEIRAPYRTVAYDEHKRSLTFRNRRIASVGAEAIGLSVAERESAKELAKGKTVSDLAYRRVRNRPLLLLHLLDCKTDESAPPIFPEGVLAYGMSFPGDPGGHSPEGLVEYIVNTVWWKNEYSDSLEDEEEVEAQDE